jgi:hypothetical protein
MRPFDSNDAEIGNFLLSHEDSQKAFSSTALAKHFGISDSDAQTILKKHNYETKQIRLGNGEDGKAINGRFWVPKKHLGTRAWFKEGWTVWNAYGEHTKLGETQYSNLGATQYSPYDDEKSFNNTFSQTSSK